MERRAITSLDAAMRAVVYGYRDGARALAKAVGMRHHVLNNKLNPALNHHLTMHEAVRVQRETRDYRILFEEARLLGYVCMAVEQPEPVGDTDLLTAWADWQTALGHTAAVIRTVLAGRRITQAALHQIRLAMLEDVRCEFSLFRHVVTLCDEPQTVSV